MYVKIKCEEAQGRLVHLLSCFSLQVSPAAFTPELSDRERFPYFFRTRAALSTFNGARLSFMRQFNWSRVSVIAPQTQYFIKASQFNHLHTTEKLECILVV